MGIVGEQRAFGRGVLTGHHPGVRADALALSADERVDLGEDLRQAARGEQRARLGVCRCAPRLPMIGGSTAGLRRLRRSTGGLRHLAVADPGAAGILGQYHRMLVEGVPG